MSFEGLGLTSDSQTLIFKIVKFRHDLRSNHLLVKSKLLRLDRDNQLLPIN